MSHGHSPLGTAAAEAEYQEGSLVVDRATGTRRALIVDDTLTDRCVLRWYAESCGCLASEARSLREMMAIMQEWPPDVLVLDIIMLDSDGIEIMRHLRAMKCELPLLLVSGWHGLLRPVYNLGAAYGLNVIDVIAKPVDAHIFKTTLRRALITDT
jgi:CheY-like chemotaxis protein